MLLGRRGLPGSAHRRIPVADPRVERARADAVPLGIAAEGPADPARAPRVRVVGSGRADTDTKSSCRSIDGDAHWSRPRTRGCGTWRTRVAQALHAAPPSPIVLADHTSDRRLSHGLPWTRMIRQTIARMPPWAQVILVADSPQLQQSPLYCLSAHPDAAARCGIAAGAAFDPASLTAMQRAAADGDASLADLRRYFCDAGWCPAIIDGFSCTRTTTTSPTSSAPGRRSRCSRRCSPRSTARAATDRRGRSLHRAADLTLRGEPHVMRDLAGAGSNLGPRRRPDPGGRPPVT